MKQIEVSLESNQSFVVARDLLEELKRELADTERQQQEAIVSFHQSGLNTKAQAAADAEALLAGEPLPAQRTEQHLTELDRRARALKGAIETQERVVRNERAQASEQLRNKIEPSYRAIVRDLAAALQRVTELFDKEDDYRRAIASKGIVVTRVLTPCVFHPIRDFGLPSDPASLISAWIRECREAGYL